MKEISENEVFEVFLKFSSKDTADMLISLGFSCMTEKMNGVTFYVFEQTPELAEVIMTQFADVQMLAEDRVRF